MAHRILGGHHHQRAQIADFICPDNGYRGRQMRKGVQPKDHMKENYIQLKNAQARAREQREEEERAPRELYKLQQFRQVSSRVFDPTPSSSGSGHGGDDGGEPSREGETVFLAKGTLAKRQAELRREKIAQRIEVEAKMEEARMYADNPSTPRKAPVPRLAEEPAPLAPRSHADFITRNRSQAKCMVPPPNAKEAAKESAKSPVRHEEFGRVPSYLEARKTKWAIEKEELRKRMPDPNCPPGMMLMSEEERASTLSVLKESREEAMRQLGKMPFVIETPSLRKRHSELEAKLREIESAISLFSKPKVYIAKDR